MSTEKHVRPVSCMSKEQAKEHAYLLLRHAVSCMLLLRHGVSCMLRLRHAADCMSKAQVCGEHKEQAKENAYRSTSTDILYMIYIIYMIYILYII